MNATIKTAIGPTILLGSGSYFDYLDPENSEITIEDYAAGLAFECRFSGQCVDQRTKKRVYYSVAQHAVIGSHLVPPEYAFDFLMHESGEPVCGDMVSPLKTLLPEYKGIEKRCEAAIMAKFDVTMSNPELIKEYDLRMWATERQQLMEWDGQPWGGDGFGDPNGGILPLAITIIPVGPEAAYEMFLARYRELRPDYPASASPLPPSPSDLLLPSPNVSHYEAWLEEKWQFVKMENVINHVNNGKQVRPVYFDRPPTPPPQDLSRGVSEDLRKRIMFAIFDPGASEGFKGDRDLTTWQTDAVVKMLNETLGGTGDDCSHGKGGVWPPQEGASNTLGNDSLSVVTAGETAPSSRSLVTAEQHNAAFDPANEALGGAFTAGFREGWIYAEIDADGERYQEMAEEYALAVDGAPQEAWDAHREKFFAMLPLAAIPKMEDDR
jgi:hypothetical protein